MSTVNQSDGWIEWAGGECPVADDAMIQVQFRCQKAPSAAPEAAGDFRWSHHDSSVDIIAYRVLP